MYDKVHTVLTDYKAVAGYTPTRLYESLTKAMAERCRCFITVIAMDAKHAGLWILVDLLVDDHPLNLRGIVAKLWRHVLPRFLQGQSQDSSDS